MLEKSLKMLNNGGFLVYIVCSFHPFETVDVISKIAKKYKNIRLLDLQSDKMFKRNNGYFINPYHFKKYGGSDVFFISVIKKIESFQANKNI